MAELAFESLSLALETTRGTAVTPPTHRLNMAGTITPMQEVYYPEDQVGELAEYQRSEIVRKWSELEADGALDVWKFPVLGNMLLAPLTSPSTPSGATNARLWEFIRAMSSDNLKAATEYWGDPNQVLFKVAFGVLTEFGWEADASGTDGATMSAAGVGQFPSKLTGGSIPSLPAISVSPLLVPSRMQLWLDTSSAIGTTEITGRVISASGTVPTGVTPKYVATGPAGGISFDHVGRAKTHPELTVALELIDQAQYQLFEDGSDVKCRVRVSGAEIESGFRNYFEHDIYGKLNNPSWGDLEGTNRTIEFTIAGEKNATLGSDCRLAVQNNKTAL